MAGHTFENSYKILEDVRHGLNEWSSALVNGTDTSGKYTNAFLFTKINAAQRTMYTQLMRTDAKQFFYTSTTITGVSSVYTLPWDFGKLLQFEDDRGYKVWPSSPTDLPIMNAVGNANMYYRAGQTLVLNKSGVTKTYTLKYFKAPRDLTFGAAAASSALNDLRMADVDITKRRDDYYNGITIDNITQGKYGLISDYTASTRSATTTNTITWVATTDYYGTVSEMPEVFHWLISPLAVMLVKAAHPTAQEKPSRDERAEWASQFMGTLNAFINGPEDVSLEDIFCDFGFLATGAVYLPDQTF